MKRIISNIPDKITLECNAREIADLWQALESHMRSLESEGRKGSDEYLRIEKLVTEIRGENS